MGKLDVRSLGRAVTACHARAGGLARAAGVASAAAVLAPVLAAGVLALSACGAVSTGTSQGSGSTASSAGPGAAVASQSPSQSPTPSQSAGPTTPAGFRVLSMSFVSDQHGFALGTVACGARRCVALYGTPDGGATWHRLTAPTRRAGGVYGTCPSRQPCVQQIRFATPLIGYAYDPSLLVTIDGGLHWRGLSGVGVDSLEAADGTVVRVVSGTTGCAGAPSKTESAPVGTASWRVLLAPPIGMICPPLLYRQGERLVLAGYGNPAGGVRATAQIDRSADGGQTWATGFDKCGGKDGYASAVALAPPDVLVLLCQHQQPAPSGVFGPAWIRVSTNGGATFGPDQTVPSLPGAPPGTFLRYQLAAASADRVLVAETGGTGSGGHALRTENAGRTWQTTLNFLPTGAVVLVGYQDPLTARIAQAAAVWTTHNGGRAWYPATIP